MTTRCKPCITLILFLSAMIAACVFIMVSLAIERNEGVRAVIEEGQTICHAIAPFTVGLWGERRLFAITYHGGLPVVKDIIRVFEISFLSISAIEFGTNHDGSVQAIVPIRRSLLIPVRIIVGICRPAALVRGVSSIGVRTVIVHDLCVLSGTAWVSETFTQRSVKLAYVRKRIMNKVHYDIAGAIQAHVGWCQSERSPLHILGNFLNEFIEISTSIL